MTSIKERVINICTTLPEGSIADFGERHLKLQVRKKTFANFMDNHHDDGRVALWCKATHDDQDFLVQLDSERYFVPPYVGHTGWVGLRLDSAQVDWEEVTQLLTRAYRLAAPKRLLKLLDAAE